MNKEFLSQISYKDDDIEKIDYFLKYRGVYEHFNVLNYLKSLGIMNVNYTQIASVFRYDKRIRRIIFKYVGFIEEYLRSIIYDNLPELDDEGIRKYFGKDSISLKTKEECLKHTLFSKLIKTFFKLGDEVINDSFYDKNIKTNLKALCSLRNAVSHNYFLLNYNNFEECNNDYVKGSSLLDNIINLYYLLPVGVKNSFLNEINDAKNKGRKKYENQTEWSLPSIVILNVNNKIKKDGI